MEEYDPHNKENYSLFSSSPGIWENEPFWWSMYIKITQLTSSSTAADPSEENAGFIMMIKAFPLGSLLLLLTFPFTFFRCAFSSASVFTLVVRVCAGDSDNTLNPTFSLGLLFFVWALVLLSTCNLYLMKYSLPCAFSWVGACNDDDDYDDVLSKKVRKNKCLFCWLCACVALVISFSSAVFPPTEKKAKNNRHH